MKYGTDKGVKRNQKMFGRRIEQLKVITKVANESLASVKRDSELATLIQGNIDNIMILVKRIEKLEAEVKRLNEKK